MSLSKNDRERLYNEAFKMGLKRGLELRGKLMKEAVVDGAQPPAPLNAPAAAQGGSVFKSLEQLCQKATQGSLWNIDEISGGDGDTKWGKFTAILSLDLEEVRGIVDKYADDDFREFGYYTSSEFHRPIDRFACLNVEITMVGKGAANPVATCAIYYVDNRDRQIPVDEAESRIQFKPTPGGFESGVIARANDVVLGDPEENNLGLDPEFSGIEDSIVSKLCLH